ncbi:hypothetical protein E0H35_24030 [Rhizobium leguminosarum bv. viciae]|nr:hypothetical protein [Rhizobium leguminosarum]MBY5344436.1 hypothetical protein [Rhizobium leguminosarum]NEK46577.1 hypothetical protein [Rhizobium leguminosarum]NKK53027.1 hypothetical protein [Rhizobium leguminosarum bv. viciae]QIO69713.1 hypothetical protein HA462_31975 [Rhizobium leguminosarum bv. trifolii]TBY94738.1 hypothetical protein E0H35_24030 [Rhizobium leguminosarum bv. viciae]
MRMPLAIFISSIGLVAFMSLNERDHEVERGSRMAAAAVSGQQTRIQQSRARLDALRGALLQQKVRLRAKKPNDDIALPT